jgi:hypothetical protein
MVDYYMYTSFPVSCMSTVIADRDRCRVVDLQGFVMHACVDQTRDSKRTKEGIAEPTPLVI